MEQIIKQQQVYFLFSRMENSTQYDKTLLGMVMDFFVESKNKYSSLREISDAFRLILIGINPETISSSLNTLNTLEIFDSYPNYDNVDHPFRLKPSVFEDFDATQGCIAKLNDYVSRFLEERGYPSNAQKGIIDLLLETIFTRNIKYLKNILTYKDESNLVLHFSSNNDKYDKEITKYYNNLILSSGTDFDEILKVLILKMFDFLSLNYNPKHLETLNKQFGGNTYYLDSSFIIRLLGFDNEFRERRSVELIEIINSIKGIEFAIHTKTLDEAQAKIDELIEKQSHLLRKPLNILEGIAANIPKENNLLSLFIRMKKAGVIVRDSDFRLYFKDLKSLLKKKLSINNLVIDTKSLYNPNSKRKELYSELVSATEKSKGRINHIVKLLDYIDKLRGTNNYNPFDIKYWLITTDQQTLSLDTEYIQEINSKSVCIIPSELIRLIDGVGEIKGNHMSVFKKFMLQSHTNNKFYTNKDIELVAKIATIVESTDLEKYDVDILLNNFFEHYSYDDIHQRTKNCQNSEIDKAIVEMYINANSQYIDSSYSKLYGSIMRTGEKIIKIIWWCVIFALPIAFAFIVCFYMINWGGISINDPKTYLKNELWGDYEGFITFITIILFPTAIWVYKHSKRWIVRFFRNKLHLIISNKINS